MMATHGRYWRGDPDIADRRQRPDLKVAVLIPCYNEEHAIGKVVEDFRTALPRATIYVYDNNSTDRTVELAVKAGAAVAREPLQGKGNVVRRMFSDIEADVYVLVDGDDTYDASAAPRLVEELTASSLDMVNAARVTQQAAAFRPGHRFGNVLLTQIVALIFGNRIQDMLSGYRSFSRRFVKSFPALTRGFEIETELTVHALELRMPIGEIVTAYKERPAGSMSKLSTIKDGFRILGTIIALVREERPLFFFGNFFVLLAAGSIVLAWPIVMTYLETGLVPRFPTAVLATGMMLLAFLSATCGLILDTVTRGRLELKRFHYLAIPAPPKRREAEEDFRKE
jgi:glycosyltransferase involved in cell wall biosynthesis